jgi:hypothetical protein
MRRRRQVMLGALAALSLAVTVPLAQAGGSSSGVTGDQALAKRILPRVADYPTGWEIDTGSTPSDSGCFSKPENAQAPTARAQASPDFIDTSTGERAGANVALYSSPARARAALRAVSAAGPLACYRTTIANVLRASGVTLTRFTRVPLTIQPPLGDAMTAMRMTFGVEKKPNKGTLIIDLIFAQRRRALVSLGFNAESSLPSKYDERATAARAIARVPG